jgi:hypothetical protein
LRLAQEAFTGEDVTLVVVPEYTIRRNTGVWPAPDDPNYKSFRANITVKVWTGDDEKQEESQE